MSLCANGCVSVWEDEAGRGAYLHVSLCHCLCFVSDSAHVCVSMCHNV